MLFTFYKNIEIQRFCAISRHKIDILPLTRANQTRNFINFRTIMGKRNRNFIFAYI